MTIKNKKFVVLNLLSSALIFSFFAVLSRTIGFSLPIFFLSWTRTIIIVIILYLFILISNNWIKLKRADIIWVFLRSLGGFIGFFGSYIAFIFLPIGTAYFIFFAGSTVGGYLIGHLFFKEKINRTKILSLFLSLLGLSLIYTFDFNKDKFWYLVAALVSGIGASIWNTFSKKISHIYSAVQINFLDNLMFFLIALFLSLLLGEKWTYPTLSYVWTASMLFGVMFLVTGQLMVYGFSNLEAYTGSLIMLSEILFGLIIGFLFYSEIPSTLTLTGVS